MKSAFGENNLDAYTKIQNAGKGAYGQVYKAQDNRTKEIVAIKRFHHEIEGEGFPSTTIREISLLREIDNKNVVQYIFNNFSLKDVIIDKKQLYLVFEYIEKDLKSYIESHTTKPIEPIKIKKFLYQMIAGIADCHSKRIIHRDLKPANILIDKDDTVRIADFGLARTYSVPVRPYSHQVVTLWYRAPEILLGSVEYSTPIDVWSIGCIFAELVTKRPLFAGDSQIDQLYRIFRILGTPNDQIWPGVTELKDYKSTFPNWSANPIQNVVANLYLDPLGLDLLNRMLKYDPNKRISAKAALKHPYFKQVAE